MFGSRGGEGGEGGEGCGSETCLKQTPGNKSQGGAAQWNADELKMIT